MPTDSNQRRVDQYLASITRRGYAKSTIKTYRVILKVFTAWLDSEQIDLCAIERKKLEAFQFHLTEGPRDKALSVCIGAMGWAVARRLPPGHLNLAVYPQS